MKINVDELIVTIISVYAPQVGLDESLKNPFYDELQFTVTKLGSSEYLYLCGDFNGHIDQKAAGHEGVHGGFGFGERNPEGERILEFAVANNLVICNSMFEKRTNHLVTYQSGGSTSQVDYILVRQQIFRLVTNTKVLPGEECTPQHKLLICDASPRNVSSRKKAFTPKLCTWKLRDPAIQREFKMEVDASLPGKVSCDVDEMWNVLKCSLHTACQKVCALPKMAETNLVVG